MILCWLGLHDLEYGYHELTARPMCTCLRCRVSWRWIACVWDRVTLDGFTHWTEMPVYTNKVTL